jgi:MFS transporter, SP family, sugar:H+ symporter
MLGFGHLALRSSFNKRLTFTVLLVAFSQLNFGFDPQRLSATQAMDSFDQKFGENNAKTMTYGISPVFLSYYNGFNYLGQAAGTKQAFPRRLAKADSRIRSPFR